MVKQIFIQFGSHGINKPFVVVGPGVVLGLVVVGVVEGVVVGVVVVLVVVVGAVDVAHIPHRCGHIMAFLESEQWDCRHKLLSGLEQSDFVCTGTTSLHVRVQ